jgi:predicted site-specific integrase-resolvase
VGNQIQEIAPASEDIFLDEKELLKRLPVSRRTLFAWRESGKIPFVRLPGSRRVIFHWPSVEASLLRLQRGTN